jgi:hypothetical protein
MDEWVLLAVTGYRYCLVIANRRTEKQAKKGEERREGAEYFSDRREKREGK